MTARTRGPRVHERWAHFRFSVIGRLLAAPPDKGELRSAIEELALRTWQHPTTGEPVRFGFSTIERWYYRALRERADPVGVLRRRIRADAGQQVAIGEALRRELLAQYAAHKSWSVKLHHDNLVALALSRPELQPVPSYATLRRFMRASGLDKRRRLTPRATDGAERAEARIVEREVRRYEAEYVNGLWHWDCHHGSRKVVTARGEWVTPILLGVLDDRSRLACHLQWYLAETAEVIAHGLSQAFQKRGLPRAALSDNGAAMTAAEIGEGLTRLGVLHHTTLPYSPYQNAKRRAAAGLHAEHTPHAEEERRQHSHRGPPLRGAQPLPASRPHRGALRILGPERRPPRRRAHRQCAGAALSAGQDAQRQRPAPIPRSARQRRQRAGASSAPDTYTGVADPAAAPAPARPAVEQRPATGLSAHA